MFVIQGVLGNSLSADTFLGLWICMFVFMVGSLVEVGVEMRKFGGLALICIPLIW